MLKVIVGKNQVNSSAQAPRRPVGAEEVKWENMSGEELGSLAATDSLFGGTRTLIFVGPLNGARGEEFLKFAKDFATSDHTFIFEEEKLLKRETDIVIKAGGKVEKIETVKKERGFDPHGLTFALGSRDKKKLWLGLMAALGEEKPEAIAGLLHWKARDMLSKNTAGKYSREEMRQLSRSLISLYHDSHRGLGDLELLLERFALKL